MNKGRILVAPLNWGLGHATRCIPIIEELLEEGFEPIIASDGLALSLLRKEFPNLISEELPSYNIIYPEAGESFRLKLLISLPKIHKAILAEKLQTEILVEKYDLKGIISDNRLGVRHPKITSVIITHQLNVLSGKTTFLSSFVHKHYIDKFHQCWVPDVRSKNNLSGILGLTNKQSCQVKYIGPMSRLIFFKTEKRYDYLVLLSGPEPQREILEKLLLEKLQNLGRNILFVRGIIEKNQTSQKKGNIKVYNFLLGNQLENAINASEVVIARSGYSTIMDLAKLYKRAFFIPTPGQYEQIYLAKRFKKLGFAPYSFQENFEVEKLEELKNYKGFSEFNFDNSFKDHLALFERK